jgi:hypothetical protein
VFNLVGKRSTLVYSSAQHDKRTSLEVALIPSEMKAVVFEHYGGPDVLRFVDFPVPQLGRGEALVKVHAVSLNGYDLMARAGRYRPTSSAAISAASSLRSGRKRNATCLWARA